MISILKVLTVGTLAAFALFLLPTWSMRVMGFVAACGVVFWKAGE